MTLRRKLAAEDGAQDAPNKSSVLVAITTDGINDPADALDVGGNLVIAKPLSRNTPPRLSGIFVLGSGEVARNVVDFGAVHGYDKCG